MSLIDGLIAQGMKNNADFTQALIEIKQRVASTPEKVAIDTLEAVTTAMQDVDAYTLGESVNTITDTQAMKDIDDFTLQQVMTHDERITSLENKVNGGTI